LLDKVRASLRDSEVDPSLIEFEITETALMHDPEEAAETLNHLLTLGVQLSIHDFGTGYSSLNYLKRFPLGKLKIDLSFVREITRSPADEAIARAVTHLGHSLGMQVLAEGVETEEQCAILRRIGCDEIQGYLISKPLPPDEFIAFTKQPVNAAFLTAASPPA
jgi:EAL domain-containing protein (putative c-di-GMP-specific phosphodiesterase class I)